MIREFGAESSSHQTGSSAIQSVLFTYTLEMAANPRGTWRFCAQCEPEKAMLVQIRRIARDFLRAKKKRVASEFEDFLAGRRPPIPFSCNRRPQDFSRSRARLAAPAIRVADRSC